MLLATFFSPVVLEAEETRNREVKIRSAVKCFEWRYFARLLSATAVLPLVDLMALLIQRFLRRRENEDEGDDLDDESFSRTLIIYGFLFCEPLAVFLLFRCIGSAMNCGEIPPENREYLEFDDRSGSITLLRNREHLEDENFDQVRELWHKIMYYARICSEFILLLVGFFLAIIFLVGTFWFLGHFFIPQLPWNSEKLLEIIQCVSKFFADVEQ